MIWRCESCGHKVSRHDEPRQGQRAFYCLRERALTWFGLHYEDQRRAPVARTPWKAPAVMSAKRGDYLDYTEEEDLHYAD